MITLDAWVSMALLCVMGLVAASPTARRAVNQWGISRRIEGLSRRFLGGRGYWVAFALLLGVGCLVRIWRFGSWPLGLYPDGAMSGAEAISLLRNGTDQYGTPFPVHFEAWQYGQMSVLLAYLTVPIYALFGISRVTMRLPMLLCSLLALPVLWDFARRALGKSFALCLLFLAVICPWQIVQSRWALDCNMMGHMLLFSVYLLYLGIRKKPLLYLSMVGFGLTMYAYGVALYTVPVLLCAACGYLLWQRRLRWWEALACAGIYLLVSAPFLLTMAINFFGWETARLGPLTLQRFEKTQRASDILLFSPNPFAQLMENLAYLLRAAFLQVEGDTLVAYPATRTLYAFSVPVIALGLFGWWRRRRALLMVEGRPADQEGTLDGLSLVLWWLFAMVVCGLLTNYTTAQRVHAIFYPLLFCMAYALWRMIRRVPAFLPLMLILYGLGFLTFCQGYFADGEYQARMDYLMRADFYGAVECMGKTQERVYYIDTQGGDQRVLESTVMVAHGLDSRQVRAEAPVTNRQGQVLGTYAQVYRYVDFAQDPPPLEDAAYVVRGEARTRFEGQGYIILDFDGYALAYPARED